MALPAGSRRDAILLHGPGVWAGSMPTCARLAWTVTGRLVGNASATDHTPASSSDVGRCRDSALVTVLTRAWAPGFKAGLDAPERNRALHHGQCLSPARGEHDGLDCHQRRCWRPSSTARGSTGS